jgi:adenylate cyclase class IV
MAERNLEFKPRGVESRSALRVPAVVDRRRTLLSLDATRIRLDNVDGLGDFIELEVPVTGDDDAAK